MTEEKAKTITAWLNSHRMVGNSLTREQLIQGLKVCKAPYVQDLIKPMRDAGIILTHRKDKAVYYTFPKEPIHWSRIMTVISAVEKKHSDYAKAYAIKVKARQEHPVVAAKQSWYSRLFKWFS